MDALERECEGLRMEIERLRAKLRERYPVPRCVAVIHFDLGGPPTVEWLAEPPVRPVSVPVFPGPGGVP